MVVFNRHRFNWLKKQTILQKIIQLNHQNQIKINHEEDKTLCVLLLSIKFEHKQNNNKKKNYHYKEIMKVKQ